MEISTTRLVILGNAGSGKSTLANSLAQNAVPVLDLDKIAWEPNSGPVLRPRHLAIRDVERFCSALASWIVEGCYGDLIEAALAWKPELIFLNPGEEMCLLNCRNRR